MSKIEIVIFDAGGVLHESNSAVMKDLTHELGFSKEILSQIWAEEIPLLGSGKIDEREFWQLVSKKHGLRSSSASRVWGDPPKISFLAFGAKMGSSVGVKNHQSKRPGKYLVFYFGADERT